MHVECLHVCCVCEKLTASSGFVSTSGTAGIKSWLCSTIAVQQNSLVPKYSWADRHICLLCLPRGPEGHHKGRGLLAGPPLLYWELSRRPEGEGESHGDCTVCQVSGQFLSSLLSVANPLEVFVCVNVCVCVCAHVHVECLHVCCVCEKLTASSGFVSTSGTAGIKSWLCSTIAVQQNSLVPKYSWADRHICTHWPHPTHTYVTCTCMHAVPHTVQHLSKFEWMPSKSFQPTIPYSQGQASYV